MTLIYKRQGFTLIELLVVVLIIGILAAVALPKYEVAVEKSRMAEALINARSMVQTRALEYLQSPGSYAKAEDIMELSGGYWSADGNSYCTDHFRYVDDKNIINIWRGKPNVACNGQDDPLYVMDVYFSNGTSVATRKNCWYMNSSPLGKKTCYAMAGEFDMVSDY